VALFAILKTHSSSVVKEGGTPMFPHQSLTISNLFFFSINMKLSLDYGHTHRINYVLLRKKGIDYFYCASLVKMNFFFYLKGLIYFNHGTFYV
jgi:hypothetical protein